MNTKGKVVNKRGMKSKKDCQGKCKYKCSVKISKSEQKVIFNTFWNYDDSEKNAFYGTHVIKKPTNRKRTDSVESRRKFSYEYYLCVSYRNVRVCKYFFLGTLDISGRRIQWVFFIINIQNFEDKRGKHAKRKVTDKSKNVIRRHINSFAKIPSHYCRASDEGIP